MVLVEYISMQILANSVDNNFVARSYALVCCLQSHCLLQLGTVQFTLDGPHYTKDIYTLRPA